MIALSVLLMAVAVIAAFFFLPRFKMVRDLRALFSDYGSFSGSFEEEREHWMRVARRYYERLGWKEGRIRNRLRMIRLAHEALDERPDLCPGEGEKVRELARRVLVCQLAREDERLPIGQTERIFQLVEIEYRRYAARKGTRK